MKNMVSKHTQSNDGNTFFSESDSDAVCGTDGRDYPTECHLEKSACERRQVHLAVRYRGRCNPCAEHRCPATEECHLADDDEEGEEGENPTRTPQCQCDLVSCMLNTNHECNALSLLFCNLTIFFLQDCSDEFAPVCASNGKTVSVTKHAAIQYYSKPPLACKHEWKIFARKKTTRGCYFGIKAIEEGPGVLSLRS